MGDVSSFLVFFLFFFLPHLFYHVVLKVRHCKGSEPSEPNNNDNIHTHTKQTQQKIYKHTHPCYLSLYCAHVGHKQFDHTTFSVTSQDAQVHPTWQSSTCTNTQCTIAARTTKASYTAQQHLHQHTGYHSS